MIAAVLNASKVNSDLVKRMLPVGSGSAPDHTGTSLSQRLPVDRDRASFGSFHAAGIELLRRHFAPAQQGRGQALYAAVSFGAGGAAGALASGVLWDVEPQLAYVAAALAAFAGWALVLVAVRGPLAGTVHAAEGMQAEGRIV